ncbi:hypothetical protein L9F63_005015 [Diploptera punctata]|uniref:Uncharacterized protein n=1 Tax=Diploptera punctata TaxID=6984 RepID=A0AAD8E6U3_DIPPU|nr:hypothetical protein L9F63_005015 [Diploptera punctata]
MTVNARVWILSLTLASVAIPDVTTAYPVFGTKRYGRSTTLPHRVSTWGIPAPIPLQTYQQPQPHYGLAPAYYAADPIINYPYTQDYPDGDYYYAQEPITYPYYPATSGTTNGNLKYSVYQSVVPYYYGDGHQRMGYGYYGYDEANDPVDDLQEEIQQEEEREEREEALPIGQETWFEGGSASQRQGDSMTDVNAAFLQNLIMSQLYNDANSGHVLRRPQYSPNTYSVVDDTRDNWGYENGKMRAQNYGDYYKNSEEDLDDEEVRELKSLVKKNRSGDYNDHSTSYTGRNNWLPSKQDDQAWYAPSTLMDNTHRPEYYEPVWFPTESGPWYENSWGSGMSYKRNSDSSSHEPFYQSIKSYNKKQESSEYGPWIPKGTINFTDRKGVVTNTKQAGKQGSSLKKTKVSSSTVTTQPHLPLTTATASTTVMSPEATTTAAPDFDSRRGQKEVALLRPPSPVRHPFTAQAITRSRAATGTRHSSSVYDTIKQLLSMEQGLRKEAVEEMDHPQPQKRFVSNEETLVEELSGLKKLAA